MYSLIGDQEVDGGNLRMRYIKVIDHIMPDTVGGGLLFCRFNYVI